MADCLACQSRFSGGLFDTAHLLPVIDLPLPVIKSLSGGKQAFVLDVRFFADYVRFGPKSGRIDTVTVESARDPKRTFAHLVFPYTEMRF